MLFYIIVVHILFYQYSTKLIVLPYKRNYLNSFNSNMDILNKFDFQLLYSEIPVGSPPQTVNFHIQQENNHFYFEENICYKNTPSFYNYSKSNTIRIDHVYDINDGYNGFLGDESFSLYNTINLNNKTIVEHLETFFALTYNNTIKTEVCGVIGLSVKNPSYLNFSFLGGMKKKGYVDKYTWTYTFFRKSNGKIFNIPEIKNIDIINNYDGILIFGEYPHEYYPNLYNESDIHSTLAKVRKNEIMWDIAFSKVYYINEDNEFSLIVEEEQAELSLSLSYIICTKSFFGNITKLFFSQYINDDKCKISNINNSGKNFYQIISCNKQYFSKDDMKFFPIIYFYNRDFNYTFSFSYKDLFEEYNNEIYFLIIYDNKEDNWWKLGKLFLEKYQFIFNQDAKTISFYSYKFNEIEEKEQNSIIKKMKMIFTSYIFWVVLSLISLIAGIIIGKCLFDSKKQKNTANELVDEDEYDYSLENNKQIN